MANLPSLRRVSRAEHVRVSFTDAGGGLRLPLASRRAWIPGLAAGIAFLVVASIAWQQTGSWRAPAFDTWIHRAVAVLRIVWLAGLWVGTAALLALAAVLLLFRESARLANGKLIHVARVGPALVTMEYELAKLRNLRADEVGRDSAVVRFDYDNGNHRLGSDLTLAEAAARVKMIQAAIDGLGRRASQPAMATPRPTPGP